MGTLPPNVAVDDAQKFPSPRCLELSRVAAYTGGVGAGFYSGFPLAPSTPSFATPIVGLFDTVTYDYQASVARGNATSGSGPYILDTPDSGVIRITAPAERPLPFYAYGSVFMLRDAPGVYSMRIGIVRYNPSDVTSEYKLVGIGEAVDVTFTAVTGGRTVTCFGFDVIPPGRSYSVHLSWDDGNGAAAALTYTDTASVRNRFGIITF